MVCGPWSLPEKNDLMVDHGQRSYVEALIRKGQPQEFASSCRGKVGNLEVQTLKGNEGYARREVWALQGNHNVQDGFFLISQNIYKKCRGAQPKVHRKYTRGSLRRRREAREKVWKTNYSRGKPTG